MGRKEFISSTNERPVIAQLAAKVKAECTPLDLYNNLKNHYQSNCSYLLESVEKEKRHARFSFVGTDPEAIISLKNRELTLEYKKTSGLVDFIESSLPSVCEIQKRNGLLSGRIREGYDSLDALRAAFPASKVRFMGGKSFDRQTFLGGAIGYWAYDIVHDCWLDIPRPPSDTPDAQFALTTKTIIFDHLTGDAYIVLTPFLSKKDDAGSVYDTAEMEAKKLASLIKSAKKQKDSPRIKPSRKTWDMEKEDFEKVVKAAKDHIFEGDIFQAVLSRRYEVETESSPLEIYRKLREVNPSPYMYLFEFNGTGIIGASPETLLTVHNRKVIINPIAGTCPRGRTPEEDEALARKMLSSEKERAEHVMLVDLGRNDVRMVCSPGTVKVERFMDILKYSHVQHIESTVTGMLREECDQFDATRAIFPAGTLSGAPKIRAMEIIHSLEKKARGIYGGGVGYYSWNGDADFAIVIRTIILRGGIAIVQAGAGIVADSDPAYEYYETERKMAAMMRAMGV